MWTVSRKSIYILQASLLYLIQIFSITKAKHPFYDGVYVIAFCVFCLVAMNHSATEGQWTLLSGSLCHHLDKPGTTSFSTSFAHFTVCLRVASCFQVL